MDRKYIGTFPDVVSNKRAATPQGCAAHTSFQDRTFPTGLTDRAGRRLDPPASADSVSGRNPLAWRPGSPRVCTRWDAGSTYRGSAQSSRTPVARALTRLAAMDLRRLC